MDESADGGGKTARGGGRWQNGGKARVSELGKGEEVTKTIWCTPPCSATDTDIVRRSTLKSRMAFVD